MFITTYNAVEFNREYGVAVAVVTNLGATLEVADFQLARRGETDHCHQTGAEQSLHDTGVHGAWTYMLATTILVFPSMWVIGNREYGQQR